MKNELHTGIIRVEKTRDYSAIHHAGPRDKRLSWGARGILAYLLTKPDNWNPTVEDLINHGPEGKAAVRRMLGELKECGYLRRERVKAERGRFIWQTTLYEVPQNEDFSHELVNRPSTENRHMEIHAQNGVSPSTGFPSMENPYDGAPSHGKSVDIRSIERRSIEEEVLSEVVEEKNAREIPRAAALAKPQNEIIGALCEVCGLLPTSLSRRDNEALQSLIPFLCAQLPEMGAAAAAQHIRERFALWDKPSPPHLSQIQTNWVRMARIAQLKIQREQNATPPPTGNEQRLRHHVQQRLEKRNTGAEDSSLARLAQRR